MMSYLWLDANEYAAARERERSGLGHSSSKYCVPRRVERGRAPWKPAGGGEKRGNECFGTTPSEAGEAISPVSSRGSKEGRRREAGAFL